MIDLSFLDLAIIAAFFSATLFVGFYVSKNLHQVLVSIFFLEEICLGGYWNFYGSNYFFNRYTKFSYRYSKK
jgi:hypothetical protein